MRSGQVGQTLSFDVDSGLDRTPGRVSVPPWRRIDEAPDHRRARASVRRWTSCSHYRADSSSSLSSSLTWR